MNSSSSAILERFLADIQSMKQHQSLEFGAALKKPLLLLLLVSRLENGRTRENRFDFSDLRGDLDRLIRCFGGRPARNGSRPEQPFSPNFFLLVGVYLASEPRKHGDFTILPNSRFCLQADRQPQELKDSVLQGRGFGESVEFVLGMGSPSDSVLAQRRQVLQKTLKTRYRKTVRRTTVVFLLLGRFRTWLLGNDRLTRGCGRFPLVIVEKHFGQFPAIAQEAPESSIDHQRVPPVVKFGKRRGSQN